MAASSVAASLRYAKWWPEVKAIICQKAEELDGHILCSCVSETSQSGRLR